MTAILTLYRRLDSLAPLLLPLAARLVFAGVLLAYFWASAATKLGPGPGGLFTPSLGAYAQIFPRAFEAAGYDVGQMGLWHRLVVLAGTWAEFVLPGLVVLGLLTRPAAAGMIGFILVQSLTDVLGHGAGATTIGTWFDRSPEAAILDQRALWVLLLMVPLMLGAGALSVDRALAGRLPLRPQAA